MQKSAELYPYHRHIQSDHPQTMQAGKQSILHDYLLQQQQQVASKMRRSQRAPADQQMPVKMLKMLNESDPLPDDLLGSRNDQRRQREQHQHLRAAAYCVTSSTQHVQKKLLAFFYIYTALIISLYLTYAVYCYFQQQNQWRRQQQQQLSGTNPAQMQMMISDELMQSDSQQIKRSTNEFETKLENKIHLLERYIEVVALDLEETKKRLAEREKCGCSINCSFNGTKFNDGQSWQQRCDTCTCQAGKISCVPRKCPKLNCDDAVQLPGQCCPTCMKKCKLNKTVVRHGHTFKPTDSNRSQTKSCKCYDGLIKCEPIRKTATSQQLVKPNSYEAAVNKTSHYLKLILRPDDDGLNREAQATTRNIVANRAPGTLEHERISGKTFG